MSAVEPLLQTLPIVSASVHGTVAGNLSTDAIPVALHSRRHPAASNAQAPCVPAPPDLDDLAPGTVLAGRYRIVQKAAEGGMGVIYEADDQLRRSLTEDSGRVALKFTKPLTASAKDCSRALLDEHARVMALAHENIVKVHNFERHAEHCFFVMEWLDGMQLKTCSAAQTRQRNTRQLIEGIARGLAAAHEQGVVHADVQPANIIVTQAGVVKLVDFGNIRRTFLYDGKPCTEYRATANYASPDVLAGKEPEPSDDVFALGVIAYELLSNTRPFGKHTALEARERGIEPAPLDGVDVTLADAVMRCLADRREARFANAGQFLQALKNAPLPVAVVPRQPGRRKTSLPIAAAAMLLLAVTAILWAERDGPIAKQAALVSHASKNTALREVAIVAPPPVATEPVPNNVTAPLEALAIADLREVTALDMRDQAVAIAALPLPADETPLVTAAPAAAEAVEEAAVVPAAPVESLAVAEMPAAVVPVEDQRRLRSVAALTAPTPVDDLPRPAVKQGKNFWLRQVLGQTPVGMSALAVAHYEAPAYPRLAREQGIAGEVDVSFAVAPNGQPVGIDIVHAEPFGTFDDAALAAVREWRFHSVDGGKHVKVRLRFIPDAS